MLRKLSASRTDEARIVERSKILLMYSHGDIPDNIAKSLSTNKQKVYRIINKALSLGVQTALHDARRSGKPRIISDSARSYIIRIACTKPVELGKSYEMWTNRSLTEYIKENAPSFRTHGPLCCIYWKEAYLNINCRLPVCQASHRMIKVLQVPFSPLILKFNLTCRSVSSV